jgi:hypothetical protein
VWIDTKNFARIRISMIQLNLSGEVLSNEERVDFAPFDSTSGVELTAEQTRGRNARTLLWLPLQVAAQQVLSTAGRTTAVARAAALTNFHLCASPF